MAQTGYTPIKLYYSPTTTNVPLAANLAAGELAINTADGKLFYKDSSNVVQVIGWKTTPATAGGTGQTSYAVGDLLYASTTTALSKLADVATGNAVISGGVGVAPSYGKIGLTTHVSGTLPVANGGTNASTASITSFNNITGYSASGATGTTSTNLVFSTSPTLITPALGTPSALVGTNITGTAAGLTAGNVTTNANLTGDVTSVGNATTLTNAPVIAKVLTGYVSGAGVVAATDSILQAIQKLNGNDATNANLTGAVTSVGNATSLGSFTSASLRTALTDETGTGVAVFGTSPVITTSLTTDSASFDLLNTTATTLNIGGAATAVNLGAATGTVTVNNISAANTFGFKNRIINGTFNIGQFSGVGAGPNTGTASAYVTDRWIGQAGGSTAQMTSAVASTTLPTSSVPQNALTVTANNAGNTTLAIAQRIESANIADLHNKTVNVQAYVATSNSATVTWTAYYANTANTWQSVGISGAITVGATSIATGTFTTTASIAFKTFAFLLGTNAATNGLMIVFSCTSTATSSITITGVQLEKGPEATSFDYRSIGTELMLCQRYYYRTVPNFAGAYYASGRTSSTSQGNFTLRFPVRLRTTPSAIETSGTASDYQVGYVASSTALTAVPVYVSLVTTQDVASMNFTTAAVLTAGQPVDLQAATTNAYLGWSAEL